MGDLELNSSVEIAPLACADRKLQFYGRRLSGKHESLGRHDFSDILSSTVGSLEQCRRVCLVASIDLFPATRPLEALP